MQNFFNFNTLLFSFFVSQTYASLYAQQESLYMALFSEISEARSLLEQLTLVSQNRPSYRSMLESMNAYISELILGVRLGCPPAVLVAAKPANDPLENILYATSVGVPSVVYDTVRSLRQARGVRLGATQRKFPLEHFILLNVLGALELLVFPLLGAGISGYEPDAASPGHVLWVQSVVFALLAGGVVLALQVVQDLRTPTCGLYNLNEALDEMVEGIRGELQRRLDAAPQVGLLAALLFVPIASLMESSFSGPALQAIREDNNAQWLQNCFTGVGLVFSLFAAQTFSFLYSQQEAIYLALYSEVSEAKALSGGASPIRTEGAILQGLEGTWPERAADSSFEAHQEGVGRAVGETWDALTVRKEPRLGVCGIRRDSMATMTLEGALMVGRVKITMLFESLSAVYQDTGLQWSSAHFSFVVEQLLKSEAVWGPYLVEAQRALELRQTLAQALDVSFHRVRLVKGEEIVDGPVPLRHKSGWVGDVELQLILEDRSDTIRAVQKELLAAGRCEDLELGLSDEEVLAAENRYGFVFPPDVRDFLQAGLPVGKGWHHWRQLSSNKVEYGTKEDTVFQIRKLHCTPWRVRYNKDRPWGEDESLEKAQDLASRCYPLIPLWQHRCIPSVPHDCGLPILSMHGCYDNLCHSRNFWTWLEEVGDISDGLIPQEWKDKTVPAYDVPFWQHWFASSGGASPGAVREERASTVHDNGLQRYVREDLRRLDCNPARLLSGRVHTDAGRSDPLEQVLYFTSVGVPSYVYDTVKSLRSARGDRLGATQRKLPLLHFVVLAILSVVELLVFPVLAAGCANLERGGIAALPGHILFFQATLFGLMATAITLTFVVLYDLWRPIGDSYNFETILQEMVSGMEEERACATRDSSSRLNKGVV
ncbi:Tyrosine-specific transport protein 1 [Durusdinium trenchii]|uniref:Tyrosine-specific transport protein 1 n=1 Tax=Durusdinium trenchii TaxID=1381693 RepID=A0ABP0MCW4_9DINO